MKKFFVGGGIALALSLSAVFFSGFSQTVNAEAQESAVTVEETEAPESTVTSEETEALESTAAEEETETSESTVTSEEMEELEEFAAGTEISETQSFLAEEDALADSEELFAEYVAQVLYASGELSLAGDYGESYLSGTNLNIYNYLKSAAADLAADGGTTMITYQYDTITIESSSYVGCLMEVASVAAQAAYDLDEIMACLLVDCPYELYWFDKTEEVSATLTGSTSQISMAYSDDGSLVYTATADFSLSLALPVSEDYQDDSSTNPLYTVDSDKASAASATVAAAKAVVAAYAEYSDLEKLKAYRDYICDAVSYDEDSESSAYGDPWQIIYVFDGDEDTNVVCEGYAKAFQYLCDLSSFEGSVTCYTVTGTMSGGTGEGTHMWNIVSIDGVSYLVDVVNSDSGTVGKGGALFLVGNDSGSVSEGYTFEIGSYTIYTVSYVYDEDTLALYDEDILTLAEESCETLAEVSVSYSTHVQTYGWLDEVSDGETSGTTGLAKRMEAIQITVSGDADLGVTYRTYLQTYGWGDWVSDGETSGTTGLAKRMEAIQIELTGEDAEDYDIYYRVHTQTYGWLDWACNGETAGTSRYSKRIEAIEIVIVPKDSLAPGSTETHYIRPALVTYTVHAQTYGWLSSVTDGETAGTTGAAKRLEAIQISLNQADFSGSIRYRSHIQTYGWESGWSYDGALSGTTGLYKRLEAIQIELTGEMAEEYDIYYRVHVQTYGWLDWAKNGETAGTSGLSKRLEAIQIVLVEKGGEAPGETENCYICK